MARTRLRARPVVLRRVRQSLPTRHGPADARSISTAGPPPGPGLGDFEGTWTNAYVRGGYGDPDHGVWAQVMATTLQIQELELESSVATDTNRSRDRPSLRAADRRYVDVGIPVRRGGRLLQVGHSVQRDRPVRVVRRSRHVQRAVGRASFESGPLAVSAFIDHDAPTAWPTARRRPMRVADDSDQSTEEVSARLTPVSFFSVAGVASRSSSTGARRCATDFDRPPGRGRASLGSPLVQGRRHDPGHRASGGAVAVRFDVCARCGRSDHGQVWIDSGRVVAGIQCRHHGHRLGFGRSLSAPLRSARRGALQTEWLSQVSPPHVLDTGLRYVRLSHAHVIPDGGQRVPAIAGARTCSRRFSRFASCTPR